MIDEILNMLLCFNLIGHYYYYLLEKCFCDNAFCCVWGVLVGCAAMLFATHECAYYRDVENIE